MKIVGADFALKQVKISSKEKSQTINVQIWDLIAMNNSEETEGFIIRVRKLLLP